MDQSDVVITLDKIKKVLPQIDVVELMLAGFINFSQGNVVVPPVGEMIFDNPSGDCHIKYGFIKQDETYTVKIASGFPGNEKTYGVSNNQGLMLVFCQQTGVLKAVLLDEGHLTDVRTAAAGALVSSQMGPKNIKKIGIVGTGVQAKMQLEYFYPMTTCREVLVWARSQESGEQYIKYFQNSSVCKDFVINYTLNPDEVASQCNLIITCTPSQIPLIKADLVQPGTHITAVGSDTAHKQEIESKLLGKADIVVADSLSQSQSRGEVFQAVKSGDLNRNNVIELGNYLQQKEKYGRKNDEQITIADLTGVAVQDIQIAKAVVNMIRQN